MSDEIRKHLSLPLAIARESYTDASDLMLACCASHPTTGPSRANWISAAEIAYEITKTPGSVAGDKISFATPEGETLKIGVQDGSFELTQKDAEPVTGRKGMDLLMKWRGHSFDDALKYLSDTYSPDVAHSLAHDYVQMKVDALKKDETAGGD